MQKRDFHIATTLVIPTLSLKRMTFIICVFSCDFERKQCSNGVIVARREGEGGAAQKLNPNYQQAKVLKAKPAARKKERFFLIFASAAAAAVSDIKYLQSHHNYSFLPFLSFFSFLRPIMKGDTICLSAGSQKITLRVSWENTIKESRSSGSSSNISRRLFISSKWLYRHFCKI